MINSRAKYCMKKLFLGFTFFLISIACLAAPTPDIGAVETEASRQLTDIAAQEPTDVILPDLPTLEPPAVGAPTRMATATFDMLPSPMNFMVATLPSSTPKPTATSTPDPNIIDQQVSYTVSGDAAVVEITFTNRDGNIEKDLFSLPFEQTNTFKQGTTVTLSVKIISESGTVTSQIKSADKVLCQKAATGKDQTAACTDVVVE